jgi:hypothetical protein
MKKAVRISKGLEISTRFSTNPHHAWQMNENNDRPAGQSITSRGAVSMMPKVSISPSSTFEHRVGERSWQNLSWWVMGDESTANRRIELSGGGLVFFDDENRLVAVAFLHAPFATKSLLLSFVEAETAFPFSIRSSLDLVLQVQQRDQILIGDDAVAGLDSEGNVHLVPHQEIVAIIAPPGSRPICVSAKRAHAGV